MMRIRYPKSFVKLLSAGFLLAVLPLLIGLFANLVAIQRLTTQSQRAVYDAARVAHAVRQLSETASDLERVARQGVILQDRALWENYRQQHQRFAAVCAEIAALPLGSEMRTALEGLVARERTLNGELEQVGPAHPRADALARGYADVSMAARGLLASSGSLVDREAESLKALSAQTESGVRLQLLLLLPLAIFLVAGFGYLLAKPIAQVEQAIRDLGNRRLEKRIEVSGPDDLEQLGHQLDWLRLRLLQLEEQKSRFLRHVSHELKTPLTALREGSELLAEEVGGPLTPKQEEIVRILRQQSVELQRLIEDLLRHGEAEFQQTPIRLQAVMARDLVTRVIEGQQLALQARGLTVSVEMDSIGLNSDASRIRIILDNLLSNAVKFSPEGGRIVMCVHEEGDEVVFEVVDEGPGVADSERGQLFEPFYRGSAEAVGTVKGSGLGLSIVREHVMSLGGEVEVGSGRGHFIVRLPKNDG
jgi:two-component system sensor histidine kinase GlrK